MSIKQALKTAIIIVALLFSVSINTSSSADEIEMQEKSSKHHVNKTGRSLADFGKQNATATKSNILTPNKTSYWQSAKIWMRKKQTIISKQLSYYLQQFKKTNDYSFALTLILISFIYGLLHAAGPGHGKVVVSSYIMANNQTMKRGIFLSFLSAFVQASVAVSIVAIPALLFSATGSTIKKLGLHFTQLSYVLLILLGTYLLLTALAKKWKAFKSSLNKAYHHNHDHDVDCDCGHSHIPTAKAVQGKWDVIKVISLVLSVGLRPCTGALYVLALALVKGVFLVGALAVYAMALGTAITISAVTMTVVGGREVAFVTAAPSNQITKLIYDVLTIGGAIVIIVFGALLLSTSFTPQMPF